MGITITGGVTFGSGLSVVSSGGGGGESYFFGTYQDGTNNYEAGETAIDSSGNFYTVIQKSTPDFTFSGIVLKYNSSGVLQWQREFSAASFFGVAVDSAGNVYACGGTYIVKYNSSGTIQWQKNFSATGYSQISFAALTVDSSDNVYVCGNALKTSTTRYGLLTAKLDSSGSATWCKHLNFVGGGGAWDIAVSSAGNVYVGGGSTGFYAAKYNSSGTLQWQRRFAAANGYQTSLGIDSSENVYAAFYDNSSNVIRAKWNSSGTLQYQRSLGSNFAGARIAAMADGTQYHWFYDYSFNFNLFKYDSSGTVTWQRYINPPDSWASYGISVTSTGIPYFAGTYSTGGEGEGEGVRNLLFGKVPSDGSKTGTYTAVATITYGTQSLTWSTSSYAESAGVATDDTPTLTSASGSGSGSTPTVTSTTTTI